jgi:signal transduction histidine kinase
MKARLDKEVIWGISRIELLQVLMVYWLLAFAYHATLWQNASGSRFAYPFWDFNSYMSNSGLQYLLFFIFSVPIWWFLFVRLKGTPTKSLYLLHIVLLPLFVLTTKWVYYSVSDALDYGHLTGSGQVWDLYIPALIYIVQFGVFHAYSYFKENQRIIKVEGELKEAALKSELAAIKAQLNPHFLYNVFNTINASVPAENEQTRQMIATLSDLFRYQLKASVKDLVPLRDELEFVGKYLELEKARFEDRLQIEFNIPANLMDEKVPPMLLQPLVENSVKHGISDILEGGKITVSIHKNEGRLGFEIADTGKGIQDKEAAFGKGVGLSNTRKRIQKRYKSQLELFDNQPQGLVVRFAL